MSGTNYNVGIIVNGVDHTGGAFRSIGGGLDALHGKVNRLQRSMQRAGTMATQAGSAMVVGLTAPVLAAGKGVVETMRGYEKASAQLAATMAVDVSKIAALQKQAEKLAGKTVYSEAQIIGAQREAAMAGMTEQQIIGMTPGVLDLATMSGMEIPQASMMVTDVLRGLGKDVKFLPGLLDQVAFASTKANQDTEQLLRGLTRFGPIARQMNMPLAEANAYLSILADGGFKAAEGGNALRTIMLRLASPTKAARAQLASLGVDMEKFREGSGATASGLIGALVQSGVAGVSDLERLKPRIAEALTVEPPEGMTREQSLIDLLTGGLDLSGVDGASLSNALGDYLASAVAGLDVDGFLVEVRKKIEETGADPLAVVNALFGKQRAAQGAILLADAEDVAKRASLIVSESAGAAAKMNATMMNSIDAQLKLVTSAKEVFQRSLWDAGSGDAFKGFTAGLSNMLLGLSGLPKPLLFTAQKVAVFSAAIGVGTIALGGFLRIAAFSLVPFGAMAKGMAGAAVRAVALTGSLLSLKAVKALVSPVGLLSVAVGGLGASLFAALKDSPLIGKTVSALGGHFREMWEGFASGDADRVRQSSRQVGRSLRILKFEVKQMANAWMQGTPEGKRFSGMLDSITQIGTNLSNAFGNVKAAVTGFFGGVSNSLGLTDDLGNAFGNLSEDSQGLVGWFLRALAGITRVGDQSESLSSIFTDLGEKVGWLIETAVAPFEAAFDGLKVTLDDVFHSSAFTKFEGLLGIESGGTVAAINDITGAVKTLAQSLFALGIASLAIFGVKRTLKGLGGMGGLLGLGGKGKGTSGDAVVGGADSKSGKGAGKGAGKGGFLAGLGRWLPFLNAGMLGLGAVGSEDEQRGLRDRLEAAGRTPEEALAAAMALQHARFAESFTGELLDGIGKPLNEMADAINALMGIDQDDSMAEIVKRIWDPNQQIDNDSAEKRRQAYLLAVHDLTQQPQVRNALRAVKTGEEGGAGAGEADAPASGQVSTEAKPASLIKVDNVVQFPVPPVVVPVEGQEAGPEAGGEKVQGVFEFLGGHEQPEQPESSLVRPVVDPVVVPFVKSESEGDGDGGNASRPPMFSDFTDLGLPTAGEIETGLSDLRSDLDGSIQHTARQIVEGLGRLEELLASQGIKADGQIDVNLRLPKGVMASGVAQSKGIVPVKLNTGRCALAP